MAAQVVPGSFQSGEYSMETLKITSTLNMTGKKVTDVATPTIDTDAATKAYVDASSGGGCFYLGNGGTYQTGDQICTGVGATCKFVAEQSTTSSGYTGHRQYTTCNWGTTEFAYSNKVRALCCY